MHRPQNDTTSIDQNTALDDEESRRPVRFSTMLPPADPAPSGASPAPSLAPPTSESLATIPLAYLPEDWALSFPPRAIPSYAPVAIDAESIAPAAPPRSLAAIVVAVSALIGIALLVTAAALTAVSPPDSSAWGRDWKLTAPTVQRSCAAAPIADTPQSSVLDTVLTSLAETPLEPRPSRAARPAGAGHSYPHNVGAPSGGATPTPAQIAVDRAAASEALDAVLASAATRCGDAALSPVRARVTATFSDEGRVSDVVVDVPSAASAVGGCLALAARAARAPNFHGQRLLVSRSLTVQ